MFNSSTLAPNTPPTMPRSQKERDAVSSLVELQQSFSGNAAMQPNSCMNSPASSPTKSSPSVTAAHHHFSPEQQPQGAPVTTSPSSQQATHPPRFELFMLPSICRQRESAVRSTLSRSLPVFGSLVRNEDDELRRESALQNERHLHQEQVQPPQAQYHSVYKVHHPQQASSSHPRPPQQPSQVTRAQAFAHAQAQAYYLAHARIQTYGYPQYQQQQQPSHSNHNQQQQQRHKKQPQQHSQQQTVMNHHVRAVKDRRNSQPWPEPNSNKSNKPARANDPASMQNSFSIRGNGVNIQRSILHEDQQPTRQHLAVGKSSSQQQIAHQEQQRLAGVRSREVHMQQAAHSHLDQQGRSHSKMALNSAIIHRPTTDSNKAQPHGYIPQQVYNQREAIQQQAYYQHQQAHEQAVHRVNQQFKQQQQQQHQSTPQQHHYPLQRHQQAMHQSKETSRQNREVMAQHESLPHRQPSTKPQPQPQQERSITISPSTTSETAFTTEADEDEEMYELEEDEEQDDEYFEDDSDPDFHRASKSKRHSGSSSSGNSNHHHHGNHGSGSSSNNSKKGKSVKEKPRWTAEMRESLLKAIITYKNLDDMTSFHWSQIGKQVGRSGKACKDQWRRALLPKIQQTFDRCDQDFNTGAPDASSFPASLQPE